MSNYNTLKNSITNAIKENGNNEITGPILQQVLLAMVNSLGASYQFAGLAALSTDPGTPDQRVSYLAIEPGVYSYFNGVEVNVGEIAFLYFDGWWRKMSCNVPANEAQSALYVVARYFDFDYPVFHKDYGLIKHGTGEIFSTQSPYEYCVDYLPVYPGQKIKTNATGTGTAAIAAFYDSDRNYISDVQGSGETLITVPANARFMRFCSETGLAGVTFANIPQSSPESIKSINTNLRGVWDVLIDNVSFDYPLQYGLLNGLFYHGTGAIFEEHSPYKYCPNYLNVKPGQRLASNLYAVGSATAIVWYNDELEYIGDLQLYGDESVTIIVPANAAYMRVCDEVNLTAKYVQNIPDTSTSRANEQVFFDGNMDVAIVDSESETFVPQQQEITHPYCGQVTPEKRYIAFGFDDFRATDFSWVAPLFNKYGFHATFNRINRDQRTTAAIRQINNVVNARHEIGDHSILHEQFVWMSPLFNGQDPQSPDGSQVAFPSNNDLRSDRGDGKNVFGKTLTDNVSFEGTAPVSGVTWAALTDAQCQTIREYYSVIKSGAYVNLLDALSNELLGTSGSSLGSWDGTKYTGGIYTGCKTSRNCEIWERICQIQQRYYLKVFGLNYQFKTWSLPGADNSGLYFEQDGKYYFDRSKTQFANCLAKLDTTLTNISRSWVDVLRNFGFNNSHDSDYPSRNDGNTLPQMANALIINGSFSKKDALVYPTLRTVTWWGYSAFDRAFFNGETDYAKKMYEAEFSGSRDTNGFYQSIEGLRKVTAQGVIAGCVWDSTDDFQEKVYLEAILQYCRKAGIEVITKQEAIEIALRRQVLGGNLIYNPKLRNTAKEFLPTSSSVPTEPDGYEGNCHVSFDANNVPILVTEGIVYYKHYGVPTGVKLRLSADIKGSGIWNVYGLKNKSGYYVLEDVNLSFAAVDNTDYAHEEQEFFIPDNAVETWNGITEDLGDKICAISVKYGSGLYVKNIKLEII